MDGETPPGLFDAICNFNADLLAAVGTDGRSLLLKRLAELIRVSSRVRRSFLLLH